MSAEPVRVADIAPSGPCLSMGTVVTHRLFNDWLGVVLEARGPDQWWVWWGNKAAVMDADDLLSVPVPMLGFSTEQLFGELARRGHWILNPPEQQSELSVAFSRLEGGDVSLHLEGAAVLLRGVSHRIGRERAEAMLEELLASVRGGR